MIRKAKSILKKAIILAKGLTGIRLIDPVEVYYLPAHRIVYPVLSKAGCSSVKLKLIRHYVPDFEAAFPEIHQIHPEELSQGRIKRIMFHRIGQYRDFCVDKKVRLVIRNPYNRYYSFYHGVTSGRNTLYRYPSGLDRVLKFTPMIGWKRLLAVVGKIPDYLADRHFRSQSYYLDSEVRKKASSTEVLELTDFIDNYSVISGKLNDQVTRSDQVIQLNKGQTSLPLAEFELMQKSSIFKSRYEKDILLYQTMRGK
jgi:hypothetical protein